MRKFDKGKSQRLAISNDLKQTLECAIIFKLIFKEGNIYKKKPSKLTKKRKKVFSKSPLQYIL